MYHSLQRIWRSQLFSVPGTWVGPQGIESMIAIQLLLRFGPGPRISRDVPIFGGACIGRFNSSKSRKPQVPSPAMGISSMQHE